MEYQNRFSHIQLQDILKLPPSLKSISEPSLKIFSSSLLPSPLCLYIVSSSIRFQNRSWSVAICSILRLFASDITLSYKTKMTMTIDLNVWNWSIFEMLNHSNILAWLKAGSPKATFSIQWLDISSNQLFKWFTTNVNNFLRFKNRLFVLKILNITNTEYSVIFEDIFKETITIRILKII